MSGRYDRNKLGFRNVKLKDQVDTSFRLAIQLIRHTFNVWSIEFNQHFEIESTRAQRRKRWMTVFVIFMFGFTLAKTCSYWPKTMQNTSTISIYTSFQHHTIKLFSSCGSCKTIYYRRQPKKQTRFQHYSPRKKDQMRWCHRPCQISPLST